MEYKKCLVQVDEILKYLSDENLQKIPYEIRDTIKNEKDNLYLWRYDESKELKDQNLDRQTIAILSYLNMEYLLNAEQKEFLKKIHNFNEEKAEREKREKYNLNDLLKNKKEKTIHSEVSLIQVKKYKWYNKVFNFIKNIFKRK